ncbi:MAG: hypothetical protein IJM59_05375 [Proteobacteria bacterium]|nr:hypothetical protein [Pseudomonadota bacterium]
MSKPTLSLLNAKNLFIASILLAGAALTACDEDKKSDPECVQECLSEEYAKICLDGKEDLQTCTAGQKCYAGSCQAASNSICDGQPPECVADASYRMCAWGTWSQPIHCESGTVCQNGQCVANPNASACQEGLKICSDDLKGYKVCAGGAWSQVFPCSDGTVCNNGECAAATEKCTATQPECTADNKGYRVCVSGVWSNPIQCTGTATCKNGQCAGEDITSKLPCKEVGEQKCVSKSRIQICGQDNYWQFMDCPADVPVCDEDECVPAECTAGEIKCIGEKRLGTCVGNSWEYTDCPYDKPVCINNACQAAPMECTPGDKKCASEKSIQFCNNAGHWETDYCSGDMVCQGGACMGECTPGEKKCSDTKTLNVCSNTGHWETQACPEEFTCQNSECKGECTEGETKCGKDYHSVMTCSGGKWQSTLCPNATPYCPVGGTKCQTITEGMACSNGFSLCQNSSLFFCSYSTGTVIKTDCRLYKECTTGDINCTCEFSQEIGATCHFSSANLYISYDDVPYWKDTICDSYSKGHTVKMISYPTTGSTSTKVSCGMCQYVMGYRWVPVDESYCK